MSRQLFTTTLQALQAGCLALHSLLQPVSLGRQLLICSAVQQLPWERTRTFRSLWRACHASSVGWCWQSLLMKAVKRAALTASPFLSQPAGRTPNRR